MFVTVNVWTSGWCRICRYGPKIIFVYCFTLLIIMLNEVSPSNQKLNIDFARVEFVVSHHTTNDIKNRCIFFETVSSQNIPGSYIICLWCLYFIFTRNVHIIDGRKLEIRKKILVTSSSTIFIPSLSLRPKLWESVRQDMLSKYCLSVLINRVCK